VFKLAREARDSTILQFQVLLSDVALSRPVPQLAESLYPTPIEILAQGKLRALLLQGGKVLYAEAFGFPAAFVRIAGTQQELGVGRVDGFRMLSENLFEIGENPFGWTRNSQPGARRYLQVLQIWESGGRSQVHLRRDTIVVGNEKAEGVALVRWNRLNPYYYRAGPDIFGAKVRSDFRGGPQRVGTGLAKYVKAPLPAAI
jgi:hypothetical protein